MQILITGATGNVGMEVLKAFSSLNHGHRVVAGVRNKKKARAELRSFEELEFAPFDFDQIDQFDSYLSGTEVLFLLRPPHISDVAKHFDPLIKAAVRKQVRHIVFLSVQGAEKSAIIPHHKIEKLIEAAGIDYTFLRPAYFMQNFSTTLRRDIAENDRVYLPSGKAEFTIVDLKDVGEVAARILIEPFKFCNTGMDLTNEERLNFSEMCSILSKVLGRKISHISPDLLSFFLQKRKEKVPKGMIAVMIMLHFLPRFQAKPRISTAVEKILNRKATGFEEFVRREQHVWR